MNLTRYLYKGPQSAASLRVGEQRELLEVQLSPGKLVKLPADHEYTQVLLELQHLEPLAPETKAAAKVSPAPQKIEKE
ncbi:hypothetical protein [Pseudomonas sp. GM30]|uniref:hypothetical protein n=1 Tax=Pseudomonas sp. GM30 TaxID=1144328 RepID=UPI0002700C9B|nr:hypothetical protein [Pseudomonas sp. GM30]EUB82780.1 hypothetical protein PMI25_003224 [Pseudomonas sp. GM30]